jgi:NAD(P)-dependent dehydrogenase (short-subunit alcohol dehydrogenase family)
MKTIAITGAASGIGAATAAQLVAEGHRVIGVDLNTADIVADLGTPAGRQSAVDALLDRCDGRLDGFVPCAGLSGLPGRPGSIIPSVNYFGTVEMISGLHEALAAAGEASVVALCSNSTTTSPIPMAVLAACEAGDEAAARAAADEAGSIVSYGATKMALARWIRRHAIQPDWVGRGVHLNAVAPGMVETAMVVEGRADPILSKALDNFSMPIGRTGRPEEVASLITFMLGPKARFMLGSIVFIDGGTDAEYRTDAWPAPIHEI